MNTQFSIGQDVLVRPLTNSFFDDTFEGKVQAINGQVATVVREQGRDLVIKEVNVERLQTRWFDRQHASHVRTRYFSGGWEHDTRQDAIDYVNNAFARYPAKDLANTPFEFKVKSNGVIVEGYIGNYVGVVISTSTYRNSTEQGATIRDTIDVASPSDCEWLIPGTSIDF